MPAPPFGQRRNSRQAFVLLFVELIYLQSILVSSVMLRHDHPLQKSCDLMLDKAEKMHIMTNEEQRLTAAPQCLIYFKAIRRPQNKPSLCRVAVVFFIAIFWLSSPTNCYCYSNRSDMKCQCDQQRLRPLPVSVGTAAKRSCALHWAILLASILVSSVILRHDHSFTKNSCDSMLDKTEKMHIMTNEEQRLKRLLLKRTIYELWSKDRKTNRHFAEWRLFFSLRSSDFFLRTLSEWLR